MEIKYADNVTLTVEITDQMVKDFKRCQEMAEKANCDGMDCNSEKIRGRKRKGTGRNIGE